MYFGMDNKLFLKILNFIELNIFLMVSSWGRGFTDKKGPLTYLGQSGFDVAQGSTAVAVPVFFYLFIIFLS